MTNTQNIKVHGTTYATLQDVRDRMHALLVLNEELGESDGRVTEINALRMVLSEAATAYTMAQLAELKAKDAQYAAWKNEQIRKAQQELNNLKAYDRKNVPADHRIDYEDKGRRRVAYYTTEDGFLKALIRLYSKSTVFVHFVD